MSKKPSPKKSPSPKKNVSPKKSPSRKIISPKKTISPHIKTYTDVMYEVMLKSDIKSLRSLCLSGNSEINKLCINKNFWFNKIKYDDLPILDKNAFDVSYLLDSGDDPKYAISYLLKQYEKYVIAKERTLKTMTKILSHKIPSKDKHITSRNKNCYYTNVDEDFIESYLPFDRNNVEHGENIGDLWFWHTKGSQKIEVTWVGMPDDIITKWSKNDVFYLIFEIVYDEGKISLKKCEI